MKACININKVLKIALLMVFSLWVGYAVGYHRGERADQRAWWASVRLDSQGNRVFDGPQPKGEFDAYYVRQNPIPEKLGR